MATLTRFGWVLMSPGVGAQISELMWVEASIDDYENLCRLDGLGVTDIARAWYQECKDQLRRSK